MRNIVFQNRRVPMWGVATNPSPSYAFLLMPDRCEGGLATVNKHVRDARIQFIDETHTYLLDGEAMPLSVSGLWARFYPHFDEGAPADPWSFFARQTNARGVRVQMRA